MSNMDDRQKAFENKYAHDKELLFRIEARACKLFGLWIGEQTGMDEIEAKAFAADVVTTNLDEPGFDDVLRMVRATVEAKGGDISDHILETKLGDFMEEARIQITSDTN